MGFISHLFYPWGFILQILALVHFFRRRGEWYWVWIIFMGGAIGAVVYMVVEVLPDAGLIRGMFQSHGRKNRIQLVEAMILENPSIANLEELGELYWDEKQYARSRQAFDRAITSKSDSPRTFYRCGQCAMELGDPNAAIPDLEVAYRGDPKMDFYRPGMFLAQAYAATGRGEEAATLFDEVLKHNITPELLYNYAVFLKSQNRREESIEWLKRLFEKKRTLPHYMQRIERPWFLKGRALLKELTAEKQTLEKNNQK